VTYALEVTPETVENIEWRMFKGTYKGATDLVTKWLWPRPAFYATRLAASLGITPNQITLVSLVLVVAAFWLFLHGAWWPGLIAAWLMTFLDTVDGKLARVTLASSRLGNVLDHGIDLIHPPFWYLAWGLGLAHQAGLAAGAAVPWREITIIIAGYVAQRVIEGLSILLFGLEIHVWRRIDTLFRQITARRNPNLILLSLGVLIGRPDFGLVWVAWWTVICLLLHGVQLAQAGLRLRRDGRLRSWMASR